MLLDKNEASRGPLRFGQFLGRLVDNWLRPLDECFLLIEVRDRHWSTGRREKSQEGPSFGRVASLRIPEIGFTPPHQGERRSVKPELITQPVVNWRDRTKVPALPKKFSVSNTLWKGLVRSWR